MGTRTLPSEDEVAQLVPGPGSVTWCRATDARTFLAAGYALLLQVAHPTVAAGVSEHSNYREDPWGRLLRTLDFTNTLIYAEPRLAAAVAREVRRRHRRIRGLREDGSRYHALEPGAYAWVWATLFAAIAAAHDRFGTPLRAQERARLWFEWRQLGRLLGVRERDLPASVHGFDDYFEATITTTLAFNDSVGGVLQSLRRPASPPLPAYALPAWLLGRIPAARTAQLATVGLLTPQLRERFELRWTRTQELELGALAGALRAAAPLTPAGLRVMGPAYLRWRRDEALSLAA
jgi:uncharacterized protein (DUF2236 family)